MSIHIPQPLIAVLDHQHRFDDLFRAENHAILAQNTDDCARNEKRSTVLLRLVDALLRVFDLHYLPVRSVDTRDQVLL